MRKTALLPAAVLAAVAMIAPMTSATAGPKPVIDLDGLGTFATGADGSAVVTGDATGNPLDGPYTAVLSADDSTLPEPGECEPATVEYTIDGRHNRSLVLTATGDVCGKFLEPPSVVTHVFTGRYDVVDAYHRRFAGTDGFLEVRLAYDGRASTVAVDT